MMKLKKKKGSVARFGIPLFSVIMVGLLSVMFANWSNNVNKKSQIDTIARSYLLKMEGQGYLNSADESELNRELQSLGVTNINLTGTTRSNVEYGNKITLSISGVIDLPNYNVANLFKVEKTENLVNFKVIKSSTAKH